MRIERRVNDSLVLVALPAEALSPQPWRLVARNSVGQSLSQPFNAAELHWVSPYARNGQKKIALVGRRFGREGHVVLRQRQPAATPTAMRTPAIFDSDTKILKRDDDATTRPKEAVRICADAWFPSYTQPTPGAHSAALGLVSPRCSSTRTHCRFLPVVTASTTPPTATKQGQIGMMPRGTWAN